MKKACVYCGRIHEKGYICPKKPEKRYSFKDREEKSVKFRSGRKWRKRALEIKERDGFCCVVCKSGLYPIPGVRELNSVSLEVHHITKLRDNIDMGLEEDNLITLCQIHHRMADKGEIPADVLRELIK